MTLSTMQEIFILIEDEKSVPLYRLNRWGRPARGALSKLKNLGYIEKKVINNEINYLITQKGENYFDNNLKILKNNTKWDKKWRLVIFNIPEKNRAMRDRLRRSLTSLGLGILQGSVWISTNDIENEIKELSVKLKLEENIKFFVVVANSSINKQIIEKAWNLPEINLKLERFIKNATYSLRTMGKGNGDRYKAKLLIFQYALIIKSDPKLPNEFIEQNILRKKARDLYLELRSYAI